MCEYLFRKKSNYFPTLILWSWFLRWRKNPEHCFWILKLQVAGCFLLWHASFINLSIKLFFLYNTENLVRRKCVILVQAAAVVTLEKQRQGLKCPCWAEAAGPVVWCGSECIVRKNLLFCIHECSSQFGLFHYEIDMGMFSGITT